MQEKLKELTENVGDVVPKLTNEITPEGFNMLDLFIVPERWAEKVLSVKSDRLAGLASHHFPVTAVFALEVEARSASARRGSKRDWGKINDRCLRRELTFEFVSAATQLPARSTVASVADTQS